MDSSTYQDIMRQVGAHCAEMRYQDALALVDELLRECPLSAELWTRRANLLLLTPDDGPLQLDDVEHALETACALSPSLAEAQLEMGHYLHAAQNAPGQAHGYFERAAELAEKQLRDALIYQIKCLAEQGQRDRASEVLASARVRFPDDPELGDYDIDEIESIAF